VHSDPGRALDWLRVLDLTCTVAGQESASFGYLSRAKRSSRLGAFGADVIKAGD
jgi:hypothetical protein